MSNIQTSILEFDFCDKLPTPESDNDFLFIERADGSISCVNSYHKILSGKLAFNTYFHKSHRYCHIKVVANNVRYYNIGDKVSVEDGYYGTGTVLSIDPDGMYEVATDTNHGYYHWSTLSLIAD